MKVVLAYEYEGHQPDETVDLDDATARTLLREGRARLTPQKQAAAKAAPRKATPRKAAPKKAPTVRAETTSPSAGTTKKG